MDVNGKIESLTEELSDDLVQFLRDIISIPSLNGDEEKVISRIKVEMENIGYDKIWTDSMGNLFGKIGTGEKLLAIDGHVDTVDTGRLDLWETDPFGAEMRDGIIYGRGACDQKGGLASAVYAGKIIKEVGLPENTSCVIVASVLEELYEGVSWQYIINENIVKPDAVLLTEPTDLGIRIGQRGRLEIKIKTEGLSCHGSAPENGKNAIYMAAPIIQEIEKLNSRYEQKGFLGKGSVTITDICSTAPSSCAVADSATIHLDRRLTTGESLDSAVDEIKSLPSVKHCNAKVYIPEYTVKSYTGLEYPVKANYPMWALDDTNPLVLTAIESFKDQFDETPEVDKWVFSTNGVATMGLFGIPTIGFGPGYEKYAHTPSDQVSVDHLQKALAFYSCFINKWNG